jgi:pimeloyl-ACP methyl ester carboxylesterase
MRVGRVVGAAAAVAACGLASAAYQAIAEARDRRRHPPPGRLVDVGGYRLHITCEGEGSPAVIICPALGATTSAWREVQRQVARETTVCVYDRAGLGYSDSPKDHRTVTRMAAELHTLLHNAGIRPPYVLAGHSLGGLAARVFTRLYPDEVAGLALIDSSHPEQPKRLPRTELRDYPGGRLLEAALMWARPLGLQRMAHDFGLRKEDAGWARHRRAGAAEILAFKAVCRDTGRMTGSLADLPLAVVTSSELDPGKDPGGREQRGRSRFYQKWLPMQLEFPALSTNSTYVFASRSGHHLNRDDPDLVARTLIGLARRACPGSPQPDQPE